MTTNLRVHLDHLITRQSLRYLAPLKITGSSAVTLSARSDQNIRFDDIQRENSWFSTIVKPDFQRATCAWEPEACVKFLKSVLRHRIIPSIILWRSSETGLVYVLDGAHRLSVLRAWMIDDWGDRAGDFYAKNENYQEILVAAREVRKAVAEGVGAFRDFVDARKEWDTIALAGGAPKQSMTPARAEQAAFHLDAFASNRTLHAQWEEGDYKAAEESFLAINRQGAPLDAVESTLIEFRNSSMARVIMSIASAGSSGHYWPEWPSSQPLSDSLKTTLLGFNERCANIHRTLFVPPFDSTVKDINVPFIVAPGHFRLQQHLIELLPLLSEGAPVGADRLVDIFGRDSNDSIHETIVNADALLLTIETKLEHLGGSGNGSRSLALVPLIYWYNRKGSFVRALMYGWMHWILSGNDAEIQERKIAFSAVRGELEDALILYKDEFSDIQHRVGAGFKSLSKLTAFIHELVQSLLKIKTSDDSTRDKRLGELFGLKSPVNAGKSAKSRSFTPKSRSQINVRSLLGASVRCEICGGVVDLKQGVQYDHKEMYSAGGNSDPENGRATHPFCNLFRDRISKLRMGTVTMSLPPLTTNLERPVVQLSLFDIFPGETASQHPAA